MKTFLKYLAMFFGMVILASLAFCSVQMYHGIKNANTFVRDADDYTCREFMNAMNDPDANKLTPLAMAALAYGVESEKEEGTQREQVTDELKTSGLEPALKKLVALCAGNPNQRVLALYTANLVSGTAPGVSPTVTTK